MRGLISHERRQVRDQRYVGLRHLVVAQTVRPYPGQLLSLLRDDRPLPAPAHIERHQQVKVRIAVARKGERRETSLLDHDPQFLLKLTDERLLRSFTGL